MRRYIVLPVFTLTLFAAALTVAGQSADPLLGTWKLNLDKSTYSPGPPDQSDVSTWEALGGGDFKLTENIVDSKGEPIHREAITRFDGADVPVKGALLPTTRVYTRTDGRSTGSPSSYQTVTKVNGKVTTTSKTVIAPDGRTRTNTTTGTNTQGQTVKNVAIFEKQ